MSVRRIFTTTAPAEVILIRLVVPQFFAPFVGVFEIGCGLAIVAGLATRLAATPLIVDMIVAIATTKVPILLKSGFWAMAHEARTDFSMLLGLIFLLCVGAGSLSVDSRLAARSEAERG